MDLHTTKKQSKILDKNTVCIIVNGEIFTNSRYNRTIRKSDKQLG